MKNANIRMEQIDSVIRVLILVLISCMFARIAEVIATLLPNTFTVSYIGGAIGFIVVVYSFGQLTTTTFCQPIIDWHNKTKMK